MTPSNLPEAGWVREPDVLRVTPFKRTTLRKLVAEGKFPAPRRFGPRMVAYDAAAIHTWIEQQRALPEVR